MLYRDIYDGPPAGYGPKSTKRYIAIHNTSNDASAEDEASYAKRRTDSVSAHYYVDSNSLIQSLDTAYGAWHAASQTGNTYAIAYEITGVNGWTRTQWLARVAWPLLARQIARDCRAHGITPQWLTVAQMRDGKTTGFVTHDDMRRAWGGTDHTDPGPNFPRDHLLALVRAEMEDTVTDGFTTGDRKVATLDAHRALATLTGTNVDVLLPGETTRRKETNVPAQQLRQIADAVKRIEAALAGPELTDAQLDAIADKVAARLGGTVAAQVADLLAARLQS